MRVVVRTIPEVVNEARPMMRLLRRLGYRASLKVMADSRRYFHELSDSRVRAQAGINRWLADYPAPSNFLNLLSCGNFTPAVSFGNGNLAEFCDPAIDARMRAAARVQTSNAQLANRRWAGVDRALVDAAPWVPLFNLNSVELVGSRVGGFRYNPFYGTLLDQLWVR
jgi:peptide/nickel transport system substrate-binding protein